MKIYLVNTPYGLKPESDEDYEAKTKLKIGETYQAEIRLVRNPRFHRKMFGLISTAWDFLPERQTNAFRSKDNFRKYLIAAAGFTELFYSPQLGQWVEIPRSMSFENMDEKDFSDLYERVKDAVWGLISPYVTQEDFERQLINF